jgi:transformation/transcription domain-associated protein
VLRQLKLGLAKCYGIAFENRADVHETTITTQLQNFVKKLVSTFGHGSPMGATSGSPVTTVTTGAVTIEAFLSRRSSMVDPTFQQMKIQFSVDFETTAPGCLKLQYLIVKLRKWIKILEIKCKQFPK